MPAEIVIYTTQTCPWCRRAEAFFRDRQLPFTQIDVTGDDEMRLKLVELSGGRRTVPQIFIGGTPIGGYTDLLGLDANGQLERLLNP